MSKRPRSDYETGDDATRAGLDPKSDGGGLLAEYIPCRTFQGSRPGYYFKLDAKGPGYYLDKRARSGRTSHAAATAAVSALVAANPALAGDLFGSEYSGLVGGFTIGIVGGTGAVAALLLPFICGTLNPVQMAVNLGLAEGEVSNERKFKNNGEPMEHGTKFGHKWYKTEAYCNGKYIDFAGTSKTQAAMEKGKL